jgi:hypothetical protein
MQDQEARARSTASWLEVLDGIDASIRAALQREPLPEEALHPRPLPDVLASTTDRFASLAAGLERTAQIIQEIEPHLNQGVATAENCRTALGQAGRKLAEALGQVV